MSDALFDGRPFRLLTVVDCHTRESLAIVPRTNFKAFQVVDVLERLAKERGQPKTVRCDNGPEFAGRMLPWPQFGAIHFAGHMLGFQRREEAFHRGIVPNVLKRLMLRMMSVSGIICWNCSLAYQAPPDPMLQRRVRFAAATTSCETWPVLYRMAMTKYAYRRAFRHP